MEGAQPYVISLGAYNLVLIKAKKGYIMCGYLNLETAERLGDAACIITGVKTADDMLKAQVKSCTTNAKRLGIKEGMSGQEALKLLS